MAQKVVAKHDVVVIDVQSFPCRGVSIAQISCLVLFNFDAS